MQYTPFNEELADIVPDDLASLKEVHEGWYVEYKSQLTTNRALAKTLSSFANQYGGWLFLGIADDRESLAARDFPGIPRPRVPRAIESLRNAAKDIVRPSVFYETRVFPGPIESIGLEEDQSIIVVRIPQGPNSPYIHNDGRIYLRVGDSSDPRPANDRSTFDLLSQRRERARTRLEKRIMRQPAISKGEGQQPFIHFSIFSDPYEMMGHWYSGGFADFGKVMRGKMVPFDNIFSTSEGFIARQAVNNPLINRIFTWEFSRACHSFITFPLPSLNRLDRSWIKYVIGQRFFSKITDSGIDSTRILDLNLIVSFASSIVNRHRILVSQARVKGPFYIKVHVANVWRTIPFLDIPLYLDHISDYGFPVVQDTNIFVPGGPLLDSFVIAPEIDVLPCESEMSADKGALSISIDILQSLGIPREIIARSAHELYGTHERALEVQRYRASL